MSLSTSWITSVDLAHALLYLAPRAELPKYFRYIAEHDPAGALRALQKGLPLLGTGDVVVRHVRPSLGREDLAPLLRATDRNIREAALLQLHRLPGPQAWKDAASSPPHH